MRKLLLVLTAVVALTASSKAMLVWAEETVGEAMMEVTSNEVMNNEVMMNEVVGNEVSNEMVENEVMEMESGNGSVNTY